jgi:hypothetical protein
VRWNEKKNNKKQKLSGECHESGMNTLFKRKKKKKRKTSF